MNDWLKARIISRQQEAKDIVSFKLVTATGEALPAFTAGAHVDVQVTPELVRQYSLCNLPGESHYLIAVLQEPASRGGSIGMHALSEGAVINISPPKNHFPLSSEAQRSLLFACGIGVTPLLSMPQQ